MRLTSQGPLSRATLLGAAALAAILLGALGAAAGWWTGQRLAFGFTFDWYVHPVADALSVPTTLWALALASAGAGALAVSTAVFAAAAVTARWMRRRGLAPLAARDAPSVDVHFGRLSVLALAAFPVLVVLLAYLAFAWPLLLGRGDVIEAIDPRGFVLLVALACGGSAAAGGFLGVATTVRGLAAGRLVRESRMNLIARASLFGSRHAKTTVVLVLALTMLAGSYAATINTNVDVADVLPRGDPNTVAAHNLTEKFKSSFTQQVTFQFHVIDPSNDTQRALFEQENREKLPDRVSGGTFAPGDPLASLPLLGGSIADPQNITDELYVRAMTEVIDYVLSEEPFVGSIGAPDFYKLINWTIAGGNNASDAAFGLPDTSREGEMLYASVEQGVIGIGATYQSVDAVTSPTWRQTAVLVTVGPDYLGTTKHIGERALEVRDEWVKKVERGETQYRVFGPDNPPQFTVDLPIANAHASELTRHDFRLLLPVIAVFIAVTLFIAFRNVVSVAATFSMLAIATVWTFGVMGAMGIALNTINLATIPLIMGVGIDYGIHMMNEYQELRSEGKTPEESWIRAGGGSALALFVGLLTTIAGLLVMVISPSLLVAQLGLLSTIALVSCYVLAIVFIPALVTIMGEGRVGARRAVAFQPSRIMPRLAHSVSRARWAVFFVLLLMAAAALASASTIQREAFGDPPRNWLESDPLRQEHERAGRGFYDSSESEKANVLVIQGDMADPAMHDYLKNVTATLREHNQSGWIDAGGEHHESRVLADTLKDLPFLVTTYLTVRDGIPGAGQYIATDALAQQFGARGVDDPSDRNASLYPRTRGDLLALLDEAQASPLSQFMNLFLAGRDYDMTVIIFSVEAETYADAEEVWNEISEVIESNAPLLPDGAQTTFFGNTAINYLFVAKQVPWLGYMSIAVNVIVVVLVFAFTRDLRVTAVVSALDLLASTLWLGVLPSFGIGLAINLTLPLVFIACVGSDYALHLAMKCAQSKDPRATFEGVGKGVLFSFLCTFGSFVVFTRISDLAGRRGMVATAIAIALCFALAIVIVGMMYPLKPSEDGSAAPLVEDGGVAAVDAR